MYVYEYIYTYVYADVSDTNFLVPGSQAAATPVGSRTLVGNHKSREGEDERRACVADFYLQQILLLAELCVGRNNDRCHLGMLAIVGT